MIHPSNIKFSRKSTQGVLERLEASSDNLLEDLWMVFDYFDWGTSPENSGSFVSPCLF